MVHPLFSSVDKKLRSLFCPNERLSIRKMLRPRKGTNETKNEEKRNRTTKKKATAIPFISSIVYLWTEKK